MPYVDQGEPKPPPPMPPVIPYFATLLAMAAGVGLYWATFTYLSGNQWLAPLVTGPLIGVTIRITARPYIPRQGVTAILAALVACLVGYVYRHVALITWIDGTGQPMDPQPGVGNAFQWLFSNDLMSFLLIAMSCYLAYATGATFSRFTSPADQQPSQS